MHHLVKSERDPIGRAMNIVEATEIARAGFDPIHDEMNDEIEDRQIPKRGNRQQRDQKRQQGVHTAMKRQRKDKLPTWAQLPQHIRELQRKIGDEMLDLKDHQQNEHRMNTQR